MKTAATKVVEWVVNLVDLMGTKMVDLSVVSLASQRVVPSAGSMVANLVAS